jgi:hypothetical protein
MTRTASFYVDAALAAYNAGFSSKAGQQRAVEDLNRAYDLGVKRMIHDELLQIARDDRAEDWDTLYWGIPDLHNWKPKHSALFARFPENVALAEQLIALRASIKAAPVNLPVRAEPSPFEVKARETLMDLMQRRKTQYLEAVALGEVFGGLPVSANTHLVTNDRGTTFLRTFFYLRGELTPLLVIIAAAEELARRQVAA